MPGCQDRRAAGRATGRDNRGIRGFRASGTSVPNPKFASFLSGHFCEGDYPGLDRGNINWLRKCALSLLSVLIGIVVLQANVVRALGHIGAFERPAISSAMLNSENVLVVQDAPKKHDEVGVFSDQVNLVWRERFSLDFI